MALLCNVSCSGDGLVGQSAALFGWWLRRGNLSKPWWPLTVSTHGLLLHRFWETGFLLQGRWETEQSVSRVQISAHFIGGVGGYRMHVPASLLVTVDKCCWPQVMWKCGLPCLLPLPLCAHAWGSAGFSWTLCACWYPLCPYPCMNVCTWYVLMLCSLCDMWGLSMHDVVTYVVRYVWCKDTCSYECLNECMHEECNFVVRQVGRWSCVCS